MLIDLYVLNHSCTTKIHFTQSWFGKGFMYMALDAGELSTLFTLVQISKMNKKLWSVNCKILLQKSQNRHSEISKTTHSVPKSLLKQLHKYLSRLWLKIFQGQGKLSFRRQPNSSWHSFTFFKIIPSIGLTLTFLRLPICWPQFFSLRFTQQV